MNRISGTLLTKIFIAAILLLIFVYDLAILLIYGNESTISVIVRNLGEEWGLFPYWVAFFVGGLFVHFFKMGAPDSKVIVVKELEED